MKEFVSSFELYIYAQNVQWHADDDTRYFFCVPAGFGVIQWNVREPGLPSFISFPNFLFPFKTFINLLSKERKSFLSKYTKIMSLAICAPSCLVPVSSLIKCTGNRFISFHFHVFLFNVPFCYFL